MTAGEDVEMKTGEVVATEVSANEMEVTEIMEEIAIEGVADQEGMETGTIEVTLSIIIVTHK